MFKPEWLLTNDAAQLLGVSPQTIRLWESLGRLPALKTSGGVRLFALDDVERVAREGYDKDNRAVWRK